MDVRRLRGVDHADDVQLDTRRQRVEQPAATADEDEMGWISSSSRTPASNARFAVWAPWTITLRSPAAAFRLRHGSFDAVGHIGHQRVLRDRCVGRPVTEDEARDAVMITFPVSCLLRGPRPDSTAPVACISSHNCLPGPVGGQVPSALTVHAWSRSMPSPRVCPAGRWVPRCRHRETSTCTAPMRTFRPPGIVLGRLAHGGGQSRRGILIGSGQHSRW